MSFNLHDIDADSTSINDVLLCWESGEDGAVVDAVDLIPSIDEDFITSGADIVPGSPRVESPVAPRQKCGTLEGLTRKYPHFVPDRLPEMSRRRAIPICMFINYMGTRNPPPLKSSKTSKSRRAKTRAFEPSPYPTDDPTPQPKAHKSRKIVHTYTVVTPTGKSNRQKLIDVSPYPTLGPTIGSNHVPLPC